MRPDFYLYRKTISAIVMHTPNGSALNLYTYGKVYIKGGVGASGTSLVPAGCNGGNAIECSVLNLYCSENVTLVGGDGSKGLNGAKGGQGGYAIQTEAPITIYCINIAMGPKLIGGSCADILAQVAPVLDKSGWGWTMIDEPKWPETID